MTTPGPVLANVVAPARASTGGSRDAGTKTDASGADQDGEGGFGDVLTKLQHGDAQKPDATPATQSAVRWQDIDAKAAAENATATSTIEQVLDSLTAGDSAATSDALPADASTSVQPAPNVNDIMAAAVLGQTNAAATAQTQATHGQPAVTSRHEDPAVAAMAIIEQRTPAPGTNAPVAAEPDDSIVRQSIAAATDPALVGAQAVAAGADNDKQARKSADPAPVVDAADSIATPSSERHKASVVRQEVHFAPVAPVAGQPGSGDTAANITPERDDTNTPVADAVLPSFDDLASSTGRPTQQIADRILTEAGTGPEFVSRVDTTPDPTGIKTALKVLHIQLQPADLGTVTVRMELKHSELSLQVEAERADTADMIRNDQDTLSKLLRSAGYNIDTASVRVADVDRAAASQQSGQSGSQTSFQSSQQSHAGASEHRDNSQRGGAGTNGGDTGPQVSRNESNETTDNRNGRGLYL